MAKGQTFPSEITKSNDPGTGRAVLQFTSAESHSYHLYFTANGFLSNGEELVFVSERSGSAQLYRMNLQSGTFVQLTDMPGLRAQGACLDSAGRDLFVADSEAVWAVDLSSLAPRKLMDVPADRVAHLFTITNRGDRIAFCSAEKLKLQSQTEKIYSGMQEMLERRPQCEIVVLEPYGGKHWIAHSEKRWITHVNICPTDPDTILYCHEGGWDRVAQRMWMMQADGSQNRLLRKEHPTKEGMVHEYWLDDGQRIGYHGRNMTGFCFGIIDKDGSNAREWNTPAYTGHCMSSPSGDMHICDCLGKISQIVLKNDSSADFETVCTHGGTYDMQIGHPHPRFSPDGKWILHTSDRGGVCQMYMVESGL